MHHHLGANPNDTNDERSDERGDELSAEQGLLMRDAAVNEMVEALVNSDLGPQATPTPGPGAGPRSLEH